MTKMDSSKEFEAQGQCNPNEHYFSSTNAIGSPFWVRICSRCGAIDGADLNEQYRRVSQELVRSAYNDVWQSFKQQYSGTQWEAEMEPWLRSFVVAANITPDMLKQEGENE
jgi:hypothetical protein